MPKSKKLDTVTEVTAKLNNGHRVVAKKVNIGYFTEVDCRNTQGFGSISEVLGAFSENPNAAFAWGDCNSVVLYNHGNKSWRSMSFLKALYDGYTIIGKNRGKKGGKKKK